MKKFYFLFLFALIASIGNLYAAEKTVTFDFSTNPGAVSGIKNGEITVSFDKSAGTTPPRWNAKNGGEMRAYAKNTITVSSVKKIKKIEFSFNKGEDKNEITSTPTGFTSPTWTGKSESVVFKIGRESGHRRVKTIKVTYEEVAETKCATPTFNLTADATYTDVQDLVITSTTEGAQIEYKIEGDKLTAPITGKQASPATVHLTANDTYMVTATATKEGLDASGQADLMFTITSDAILFA